MPPFLSVRHADGQTRSLTEGRRLENSRGQQRTVEVVMGLWWEGWISSLGVRGIQKVACIFDSGTSGHSGLTERKEMDYEWMKRYLDPGATPNFHINNICILTFLFQCLKIIDINSISICHYQLLSRNKAGSWQTSTTSTSTITQKRQEKDKK